MECVYEEAEVNSLAWEGEFFSACDQLHATRVFPLQEAEEVRFKIISLGHMYIIFGKEINQKQYTTMQANANCNRLSMDQLMHGFAVANLSLPHNNFLFHV